jgi:hypothetical protein
MQSPTTFVQFFLEGAICLNLLEREADDQRDYSLFTFAAMGMKYSGYFGMSLGSSFLVESAT